MKQYVSILILLLVFSCIGPEAEMFNRFYMIENTSSVNIKLKFYRQSTSQLENEISLEQNQIFEGDELEFASMINEEPDYDGPARAFNGDSLIIIFNNAKILNQKTNPFQNPTTFSEPINRNIFRHGNYEDIGNDQFVFTITQEDFDNATPCDGPCE